MNGEPSTPGLLEDRGLFTFDNEAVAEVTRAFYDLDVPADAMLGERPAGAAFQELALLTAAELALAPILVEPRRILPVGDHEPIQVPASAARIALHKADCVNIYYCVGRKAERGLTLPDVTAFGGDVSKLAMVGVPVEEPPREIGDIARAVDDVQRLHLESPSELVRRVGESGVLRLQGFLWAIKLSLPGGAELAQVVGDSYEALELEEPVAGAPEPQPA